MKSVKEDMLRINIPDVATLLSIEMLSPESVSRYVNVGDLNTEDHPQLEYSAPKAFFIGADVSELLRFDERFRFDSVGNYLQKHMGNKLLTDEELHNIGFYHTDQYTGNLRFGYATLRSLQTKKQYQNDIQILKQLAKTAEILNLSEETLNYCKKLAELEPANPDILEKYAWLKYSSERNHRSMLTSIGAEESEKLFQKSIDLAADTVDRYRLRLADLYYGTQRYSKAGYQYARAIQIRGKYVGDLSVRDDVLFLQLARCLNQMGKDDRAIGYALQAININPRNEEARDFLYELWMKGMKKTGSK
jgi:tetratricopeptide (TPR) repeat protein